jgi:hypothetical protein
MTFEKNTGRFPAQVKFVARSGGGTLFLTNREAVLALSGQDKAVALRLKLARSNPGAVVTGLDKQSGIVNYLIGNDPKKWHTNVPTYSRVKLAGVYPGVDLVYYGAGKSRTLEYDFVVKPGADPSKIRMAVSGARSLRTQGGKVIASTDLGDVALNAPYAYQTVNGLRKQVACAFTLERNTVAFQVARYDATRPLIVDPTVVFSTYLGGSGADYQTPGTYGPPEGIAVDSAGGIYVTGCAGSANFPTTAGSYQPARAGTQTDAYITKFNVGGATLAYSTYLGGTGADYGYSIAVDSAGAAYVTGAANAGFPTTPGAYDVTHNGLLDVFVSKLSPDGSVLAYSTLLGGDTSDYGHCIVVDASDNVVVGGYASAPSTVQFPTTAGALQLAPAGLIDGFVAKLDATGATLLWSTLLAGTGNDSVTGVVVEPVTGNVFVAGMAGGGGFPSVPGCYDSTANGGNDGFVAKLNSTGSALIYGTFLGGGGDDRVLSLATDGSGNAYVTGMTATPAFPTTGGAYDTSHNGGYDVFVTKLNAGATALSYSTFMGGAGLDRGLGIIVDAAGRAWVAGMTPSSTFPTTADAYQPAFGGGPLGDGFVARLGAAGSTLEYSTFVGGVSDDAARDLAIDAAGSVYATGYTAGGFPTTVGAYQTVYGGSTADAWVAQFDGRASSAIAVAPVTGQVGEQVYITATLTSGGSGIAGATVTFTMPGGATVDRTTDATGIADYYWDIPVGQASTTIGAAFAGDGIYGPSTNTGALTVTVASKVTVLPATGTAGQSTGISAYLWDGKSMSGLTGKQLTLKIDGGSASNFPALTAGAYGKATYTYAIPGAMSAGAHTTTVDWAGGGGYPASQGAGTLTVNVVARTYIWVHSHGATQNVATRLTCYLYDYRRNGDLIPVAGKSITFSVGGTTVGTATTASDGKAFGAYTPASTGALAQSMSFAGDAAYAAATGTGTLTVAP